MGVPAIMEKNKKAAKRSLWFTCDTTVLLVVCDTRRGEGGGDDEQERGRAVQYGYAACSFGPKRILERLHFIVLRRRLLRTFDY